jgi:hypothetical protein
MTMAPGARHFEDCGHLVTGGGLPVRTPAGWDLEAHCEGRRLAPKSSSRKANADTFTL